VYVSIGSGLPKRKGDSVAETMRSNIEELSETHIFGDATHMRPVRCDSEDARSWLADAPECMALQRHQIAHAGLMDAAEPFRVVRNNQSGTFCLGCLEGEGSILVDGEWQVCRAGQALLLPPFILNAFHSIPGKRWRFVWVRYQQPPDQKPIFGASHPALIAWDAHPLADAVEGLLAECANENHPSANHHWVELVHHYVLRLASPLDRMDERLWKLWTAVEEDLARPWTLDQMASRAHLSAEHLRRLCHTQFGRSPQRHLTFLRMRRAAELLSTSELKVEAIAHEVGYENPFTFSNRFKAVVGWRPSEHRSRV
jgi:AraC-like DNA-binding protein